MAFFYQYYLTFTLQTYHYPDHRFRSWSTQMTSPSHLHRCRSAAKKYIHPDLHTVFAWTKQNNLTINQEKTTCALFTPDLDEYKSNLDLKINNPALPMATHPMVLGLTLDPNLTYSTHISNISRITQII